MFLGALESWESQPLGGCFILQMWPVLALQFDFGFLSNDAAVLHLIILVLHLFPTIIYVLGCVRKLGITPFREIFQLVNVATTCLTIKFRVLSYYKLRGPSIDLPFHLIWVIFKYNFYTIVMYYIPYKLSDIFIRVH